MVVVIAVTLLSGWSAPLQAQAPELQLSFDATGTVTLKAHRVTVREILAEWARQCGCHIVNADKLTGAPLAVPVVFEHAAQGRVLESLLRQAAGFALTPKRANSRIASEYEVIYILASSSPSASAYVPPAYTPPAPVPAFPTPGAPDDEIPPVIPAGALRPGQPPDSPPAAAPAPRPGYAPGTFVPVPIVPIAPITTPPIAAPGTVTPMPAPRAN
jgi:hypothetical protein